MQIHGESSFGAFRNLLPSLARGCQTIQQRIHVGKAFRKTKDQIRNPLRTQTERQPKEQGIQHFRKPLDREESTRKWNIAISQALAKFRKALRTGAEEVKFSNSIQVIRNPLRNFAGGLRNLPSMHSFENLTSKLQFFVFLSIVKTQ